MTLILPARRRQRGFFLNPYRYVGGGGGGSDPQFSYVKALLRFDGTDGTTVWTDAKSHTFYHSGSNMTLSNGQVKFGNTSARNNGNVNGVRCDAHSDFKAGTNDFTFEWWQYITSTASAFVPVDMRQNSSGGTGGSILILSSGTNYQVYNGSNSLKATATSCLATNVWQFYRVDRYGGTTTISKDGVSYASFSDSSDYNANTPIVLMAAIQTGYAMPGYMSNFRFTIGYSRAQGSYPFSVPTAAFPNS